MVKKLTVVLLFLVAGAAPAQYAWNGAEISTLNAENFWVYPSSALGADGCTYVAYRYKNMDDVRIQKWNGTSWAPVASFMRTDVPNLSNMNDYQSLAVDKNNHLHIAFRGNHTNGTTGVWYGYYNGTSWSFEYAFSSPSASYYINRPIIAVDGSNIPYIGFVRQYSGISPSQVTMKCSARSGGVWTTTDIETIVEDHGSEFDYYDFTVSAAGVPQAVYADEYNNDCLYDVRYEYYDGSAWVPSTIATGVYAGWVSLAVNSTGKVFVAMSEQDGAWTHYELKLYTNTSGSFTSQTFFSNDAGNDYAVADLKINGHDDLGLFYYDLDPMWNISSQKILLREGAVWTAYTSTTPNSTLLFSEGAYTFDDNKNVVIVYTNDLDQRPRTISYATGIYSDPMPVELTTFTASSERSGVVLRWKTATEVNNYGFEIQTSDLGSTGAEAVWRTIGFAAGAGTSNTPKDYAFVDADARAGTSFYRLKQIDRDGTSVYSMTVEVTRLGMPASFSLHQNYPNPFNPATTIPYDLAVAGRVVLKVYDALGKDVATLVDGEKPAGRYDAAFDAARLPGGVYFYTLRSGGLTSTKKFVLLR